MTRHRRATLTLGAAILTTGLMAGVFFAYVDSVMPALGRVDDRTFINVMQQIDDVIQNPVFFTAFFGAPVLIAVAAVQQRRRANRDAARWLWVALGFYVLGLLVTSGVNVPLNGDLVAAGDPDKITNVAAVRDDFEDPWNAWNVVRTILHIAALACLAPALVHHGRNTDAE